VDRSVPAAKHFDEMISMQVTESVGPRHYRDVCRNVFKPRLHGIRGTPTQRRLHAGRWGQVVADEREHLADEAVRCPVRQADGAARTTHPCSFGRRSGLVRREHDAEGRDYGVEACVIERQRFGVCDPKIDIETFRRGAFASTIE